MKEQSISITQLYLLKELEVKKIDESSFVAIYPQMDNAMLMQITPIMDYIGGHLDEERNYFIFDFNPVPKIKKLFKEHVYLIDDNKFNGY